MGVGHTIACTNRHSIRSPPSPAPLKNSTRRLCHPAASHRLPLSSHQPCSPAAADQLVATRHAGGICQQRCMQLSRLSRTLQSFASSLFASWRPHRCLSQAPHLHCQPAGFHPAAGGCHRPTPAGTPIRRWRARAASRRTALPGARSARTPRSSLQGGTHRDVTGSH